MKVTVSYEPRDASLDEDGDFVDFPNRHIRDLIEGRKVSIKLDTGEQTSGFIDTVRSNDYAWYVNHIHPIDYPTHVATTRVQVSRIVSVSTR